MYIVTSFFTGKDQTPWQWNFKWMKDAQVQFDKSLAAVAHKHYSYGSQKLINAIRQAGETLTISGDGGEKIKVVNMQWKREIYFMKDDVTLGFITLYSKKPQEKDHE